MTLWVLIVIIVVVVIIKWVFLFLPDSWLGPYLESSLLGPPRRSKMTVKSFHAPHLGRSVKLGRKRPAAKGPRLSLKNYLRAELPAPPASCDYSAKAASVLSNVYLNDQLGDCVIAGGYHIVAVETGNATGTPFAATNEQLIADYSAIGGYVPGDPNTDQGCDEQTALNYWTQKGFANGTKLVGWVAVDATNKTEVMQAMNLFENLYLGIELPDAWVNPFPSSSGFTWDVGTPDPSNGHCVMAVGYTDKGVLIDTWGLIGVITWEALAHLCSSSGGGELYVLLSPDQLAKGQTKAPNGFAWSDLLADFEAIGGNVPPQPTPPEPPAPPAPPEPPAPTPPDPTPPSPPDPTPPVAPPLDGTFFNEFDVLGWAAEGVIRNWPNDDGPVTLEQAIKWVTIGVILNWPVEMQVRRKKK